MKVALQFFFRPCNISLRIPFYLSKQCTMNRNDTLKISVLSFLSFGIYFFLDDRYFHPVKVWFNGFIHQGGISHILAYLLSSLPLCAGILLMHGSKNFASRWGLNKPVFKGMLVGLVCTLPMFIGFALVFKFNTNLYINEILIGVIAAGFFEELFFRAFLFGQLYRYTRLGFIPSVFLGALLFATIHLYQSHDVATLAGIFAITFLGAVLFAWAFIEWDYNIWVPVFLHGFMNLAWTLFSVSDNALGNMYGNIFRTLTIALIICVTILYKKRKGLKTELNKKTVWMKRD